MYVACIEKMRNANKILVKKSERKILLRRRRVGWTTILKWNLKM
jgi:hypothetical protein